MLSVQLQRLDRWIARADFNLLIPPLIFGGNWNLPMTPRGAFLGVLTAPFSHGYPCVVTQARWQSRTPRGHVRAPLLPVADRLDWEATPLISSP